MLTGLDALSTGAHSDLRRRLRVSRVALLSHAPASAADGRSARSALEDLGVHPRVFFGPEHGVDATAQAEEAVPSEEVDPRGWAARTISLYGTTRESLSPRPEDIAGMDLLLIDLCDVGSRYYTYVWTALFAARVAADAGVHTLVLDRPNPLSGRADLAEGRPQDEGFLSFVGAAPIPIRHGLTLGELLVHCFRKENRPLGRDGALSVIAPLGWERHETASAWGRPFVPPSPNMPTLETALLYPGACLIEATNLSEGRGTTTPFRAVGAPFLDADKLAAALRAEGLPGLLVRPHHFIPTFEKHAGKPCHGVMLHVTNPATFRPVRTTLTLLALARRQAPQDFALRTTPYEFEAAHPALDLLTGSAAIREALLAGAGPSELAALLCPVDASWNDAVRDAERDVQASLPAASTFGPGPGSTRRSVPAPAPEPEVVAATETLAPSAGAAEPEPVDDAVEAEPALHAAEPERAAAPEAGLGSAEPAPALDAAESPSVNAPAEPSAEPTR